MQEEAEAQLAGIDIGESTSLALFHPDWHQGVIGIVASRVKERAHRPTIAFARGNEGEIKGSGRSIPGLHLRDALDLVSKREPGLLIRFGGHAMAAGLTVHEHDFERFRDAFEQAVADMVLAQSPPARHARAGETVERPGRTADHPADDERAHRLKQ